MAAGDVSQTQARAHHADGERARCSSTRRARGAGGVYTAAACQRARSSHAVTYTRLGGLPCLVSCGSGTASLPATGTPLTHPALAASTVLKLPLSSPLSLRPRQTPGGDDDEVWQAQREGNGVSHMDDFQFDSTPVKQSPQAFYVRSPPTPPTPPRALYAGC
jgi:hypothetical protein